MRRNPFFFFMLIFTLLAGLFTSAFSAPAYQANPTQQQATIEARVNDLFTLTAVTGQNQTATIDALTATAHAFETEIIPTRIALTQTEAVENTVQAEFNQRVTATAAFNLTVDARVSELVAATAVAASHRGKIQIGEPITTELENAGGDRWTFDGLAGDLILVEMTSTEFIPHLELYDPNNQLVATGVSSGINSRLGFELAETGTYTLLAKCSMSNVGSTYTLTLRTISIRTIEANDFDTDLTPYFAFPIATDTPTPTPTFVPTDSSFTYSSPNGMTFTTGNWNLIWDREAVECPTTQITYLNFTSSVTFSPDGMTMMRAAYYGASASYDLISPGVYTLSSSYMDLAATVASETVQFSSPTRATGQRTDIFGDYQDCTITNTYRMEYISRG